MKRSLSLDFLKILLSFIVVTAHLDPLFEYHELRSAIWNAGYGRALVPCFFAINGFFLASKLDDFKAIRKYMTQLIIVYLLWSTFYAYFYYEHMPLTTIIGRYIFGYYQLWYLPALMWSVPLLIGLRKFIKNDLYILLIILFVYMVGHTLDTTREMAHYYRNGFFIGMPFVTLGYFIRKYNVKEWFKTWHLVTLIVLSIGTLSIESILNFYDGEKVTDMFLSNLFLCPAAVLLALKKPLLINRSKFTDYFGDISTGVYYVHLFFVFKLYTFSYNIYMLPAIFILAVLTTIPLIYINKRVKYIL